MLQQHATDDRAEGCAARGDGGPDAERQGALPIILENVADDGQRCRHHHRGADGQRHPGGNQCLGIGRKGRT